jgi:hypothetical protein
MLITLQVLLACTDEVADSGLVEPEGLAYEGDIEITAAGAGCNDGLHLSVTTAGVPELATMHLLDGDEEHPLRLSSVDPAGWWSTWGATLVQLSAYEPGQATALACGDVTSWSAEIWADGELADACSSEDTC